METKIERWWLISDEDMKIVRAALEETDEWCSKASRGYFRNALHALDSGLHTANAVPSDVQQFGPDTAAEQLERGPR